MLTRRTPYMLLALTGLLAAACNENAGETRVDQTLRTLRRTDGGYYVELPAGVSTINGPGEGCDPIGGEMTWPEAPCTEERDGMDADGDGAIGCGEVIPECGFPDECALLQYRELHTVLIDGAGNLVSETFEFCTQCFAADGSIVGPEACTSEPLVAPDSDCWEEWKDDGTTCYVCAGPDGSVTDDGCSAPPPPDDCWGGFCDARPECCGMTFDGAGAWDETCDLDLIAWCEPYPGEPPVDVCFAAVLETDPSCEREWNDVCDTLWNDVCGYPEDPAPPEDDCFARLLEVDPSCGMEWSDGCEALFGDLCGGVGGGGEPCDPVPPGGGEDPGAPPEMDGR